MHRDKSPPGTLQRLPLKVLALGGEPHGYETANYPPVIPIPQRPERILALRFVEGRPERYSSRSLPWANCEDSSPAGRDRKD